ncbi:MAG: hypothetical protein ACLSAP_04820 [Oscillospiraceae bacterium]
MEKYMRRLLTIPPAGLELRYVTVTEYKRARIHHHLVIPAIALKDLQALWEYGVARATTLYSNGQYSALAEYLVKETRGTFRQQPGCRKRRWNGSKNLVIPETQVRVVNAKKWRKQPRARKGYIIETDSVENGVCAVTGMPYQFYRLLAVDAPAARRKDRRKPLHSGSPKPRKPPRSSRKME